ncbi:MAG: hypothetical protein ACXW1R_06045 [Halobacteriota archaeon]
MRFFVLSTAIHEEIVIVDLARYGTNTTSKKMEELTSKVVFHPMGILQNRNVPVDLVLRQMCAIIVPLVLFEFNQVVKHVIS